MAVAPADARLQVGRALNGRGATAIARMKWKEQEHGRLKAGGGGEVGGKKEEG